MRFWWYALRCWLGRPSIYRQIEDDIDYAMCKNCNRQTEVHDQGIGGPERREWLW